MFHVFPRTSEEWVITLLRPIYLYFALAYPAYLLLYRICDDGLLVNCITYALIGFCMLSWLVLLVSVVILFFIGPGRDSLLYRWAFVNLGFVVLGVVLWWYIFYR